MADDAPLPISSIKARISALNLEQVGATPGTPPPYTYDVAVAKKARPPPPPPPGKRPTIENRSITTNNPPIHSNGLSSERTIGNKPIGPSTNVVVSSKDPPQLPARPSLPPRPSQNGSKPPPPSLPPRRPSEQSLVSRKTSIDSISSVASIRTTNSALSSRTSFSGTNGAAREEMYRVKAPAFDPSTLPPLPPKREQTDDGLRGGRNSLRPTRTTSSTSTPRVIAPPPERHVKAPLPERSQTLPVQPPKTAPPTLPDRPALPARPNTVRQETPQSARPKKSALSYGMNQDTESAPPLPSVRPGETNGDAPPPVPLSSRPDLSSIMSMKPKPGTAAANSCLKCRDFSGPDNHAARFPRQSIPSTDLAWLAHQLTSPFPSATDKARALFTWLHHNVAYDVDAFFHTGVKHQTPAETISRGAAVCSGYAGIFTALATHAGLESVVIGGDGKGFGYTPLKPGEPVPPFKSNHAWNAVKIDNGEWKLIDSCWGAGNVGNDQKYTKQFKPNMFVCDNIEFGMTHFPEDRAHFYRPDGRTISWEEYMLSDAGETVTIYTDTTEVHGYGKTTFYPQQLHIKVNAPEEPSVVRFQFSYKCPHWTSERNGAGKPYVMLLNIGGRDGRKEQKLPFLTDGHMWWVDVARQDLGCPGQKINVWTVKTFGQRDGRGLTVKEYKEKEGRIGMSFGGICHWVLV